MQNGYLDFLLVKLDPVFYFATNTVPHPLNFDIVLLAQLQATLHYSGCQIYGLPTEVLSSLKESQFRNLRTGRGPGVGAVLGEERAEGLLALCLKLAEGSKTRIKSGETGKPIEGTEGRGLQQLAADILCLAVFAGDVDFCPPVVERINRRILKGLRRVYKNEPRMLQKINNAFISVPEPSKELASAVNPEENLVFIWRFLTKRL